MNCHDLQIALRRANALGLNMPTVQSLIAVASGAMTKEQVETATGTRQAWKCITSSPLFDVRDGKSFLSEKGEETIRKITK